MNYDESVWCFVAVFAWEDVGCYKDTLDRAMDDGVYDSNMTRQMCLDMCIPGVRA